MNNEKKNYLNILKCNNNVYSNTNNIMLPKTKNCKKVENFLWKNSNYKLVWSYVLVGKYIIMTQLQGGPLQCKFKASRP